MESEVCEMMPDGHLEPRSLPADKPITAQQLAAQQISGVSTLVAMVSLAKTTLATQQLHNGFACC